MKVVIATIIFVGVLSAFAAATPTGPLRGNKKKLAAAAIDNKKIDQFFKPSGESSKNARKRSATEMSAPVCPAAKCDSEMVERVSTSVKNCGRRYLKCLRCETFQWKGETSWCDANGKWYGGGGGGFYMPGLFHEHPDSYHSYYGSPSGDDHHLKQYHEWHQYQMRDDPYQCHLYREAMEAKKKREEAAEKEGA